MINLIKDIADAANDTPPKPKKKPAKKGRTCNQCGVARTGKESTGLCPRLCGGKMI